MIIAAMQFSYQCFTPAEDLRVKFKEKQTYCDINFRPYRPALVSLFYDCVGPWTFHTNWTKLVWRQLQCGALLEKHVRLIHLTAAQDELLLIFIMLPLHFTQVSGWEASTEFLDPDYFFGHETTWNLRFGSETGNWLQYQPFAGGKVISEDVTLDEVETTGITQQVSELKVVSLCVCARWCATVCVFVRYPCMLMRWWRQTEPYTHIFTNIKKKKKDTNI